MNYHNFEITDGDVYYSKGDNAHDSNPGTIGAPKATLTLGTSQKIVIGTGVYVLASGGGRFKTVQADGNVVLKAGNLDRISGTWIGIRIEAQPGFYVDDSQGLDGTFQNCEFIGGDWTGESHHLNDGLVTDATVGANSSFYRCIFINSSVNGSSAFRDNYIDFDSTLTPHSSPSNTSYCNIQGVIIIGGNKYAVQDQFVGTPQDNGYAAGVKWLNEANLTADGYAGTIAGWDNQVATCMNRDPLFTDISLQAFTLQSNSPMIGKSSTGGNITGRDVGSLITLNSPNGTTIFVVASAEMDISNPLAPVTNPGESRGTIRYIWKFPGNQPVAFNGIVGFKGLLQYDADYAGGSAQNKNVPSYYPVANPTVKTTSALSPDAITISCNNHGFQIGQIFRYAGEDRAISAIVDVNTFTLDAALRAPVPALEFFEVSDASTMASMRPNKLDYRWRTSSQFDFPDTPSKWDNDVDPSFGIAGQYLIQRLFTTPQKFFDGLNVYGNADPDRPTGLVGENYSAQWAEAEVTYTNEYKG
jgi:hypothetical protein